jgi:hypothetical protein
MATHISSAEPEKLFRYSDFGTRLDRDLIQEADRLATTLRQFEAACTELDFRIGVSHFGSFLSDYGTSSEPLDFWVRLVGKGFQVADWIWTGILPGLPDWRLSTPSVLPGLVTIILFPTIISLPDWLTRIIEPLPSWFKPKEKYTPPSSQEDTGLHGKAETKTVEVNQDAPTDDCVEFVREQRNAPAGFTSDGFYSGKYKGKSGYLDDGTEYGQVPRPGAIMVESPNPNAGINYGHASYVYEVEYDDSGKAISYKIAEGNWPTSKEGEPPPPAHYEEFHWDDEDDCYVSDSGKRHPDMFIY